MSPAKLNFTKDAPISYDDIVTQWRKRDPAHMPFSGKFLVEFVTQLSRTSGIDVSTAQVKHVLSEGEVCGYTGKVCDLVSVLNQKKRLLAILTNSIRWTRRSTTLCCVKCTLA